jgi:hypothetical protein
MTTKSRMISKLIDGKGIVKSSLLDSDGIGVSTQKSVTTVSGTAVYSSADTLPATATSGDQAFVTSTNRLYIYSGSGWYNIALVNNTPYWTTEAGSTYSLAKDSTPTVVTILAVDSDGTHPSYSAVTDSNFDAIATITKDSDSGRVFTIVPIDSDGGSQTAGSGTVTFKATDGISLVSTVSTFTILFSVANSRYSTLLAKADTGGTDNQVDASTNTYTITEAGDVTSTALTPYHPGGYSTYMSSAGHCLIVPLAAMTGDWTIESWVYHTANSGTSSQNRIFGGATNDPLITNVSLTGLDVYINNSLKISTTSSDVSGSKWYHFALVRDDTAGTLKLFVNGVLLATDTEASDTEYDIDAKTSSPYFGVGSDANNTAYGMTGYMKDFRVVNGTAVYSTNFTPPTTPLTAIANTEILLCNQPYHRDMSGNNHTVTFSGTPQPTRNGPYDFGGYAKADDGGSVYFDGSGDYLTAGSASDGGLSGTFTIEFWMYQTTAYSSKTTTIVSNYDGGSTNWSIQQRNGGQMWLTTAIGTPLSFTHAPIINTWYHIAFSNDSSNSTGKLFINGIEVDNHTGDLYNSTHMGASSQPITIGRLGNNNSQDFVGYISDLRIIDGTMLYTSNFTPPTAPLTAITNTKLLTCTNKNDIWEQADGKPFTKVTGGPTVSNTQRKFTTSSALYFAGTANTYLLKDLGETIGTRDFTVEAWVYPTTTGAQHVFQISNQGVGYQTITSQNTQVGIGMNNGFWRYGTTGWNFGYIHTTTAVVINTWHHVAYVRTGGYSKLYLNGTEIHSNADTSNYSARYLAYGVGHQNNNVWYGYTQDLRITLGHARYTGAFTPPTSTFDG